MRHRRKQIRREGSDPALARQMIAHKGDFEDFRCFFQVNPFGSLCRKQSQVQAGGRFAGLARSTNGLASE